MKKILVITVFLCANFIIKGSDIEKLFISLDSSNLKLQRAADILRNTQDPNQRFLGLNFLHVLSQSSAPTIPQLMQILFDNPQFERSNVNARDDRNRTPLFIAATASENPDIVKTLINNGARIENATPDNKSLLSYFAAQKFLGDHEQAVIAFLNEQNIKNPHQQFDDHGLTPLSIAAVINTDIATVEKLINNGAKINDATFENKPLLSYFAAKKSLTPQEREIVKLLLIKGADKGVLYQGEVPLQIAIKHKNRDMMKLL